MRPQPPHWADQLLEWFCAPHLIEEVQGDLQERFQKNLKFFGEKTARWEYIKGVLGFIKPFALKRNVKSSQSSLYLNIMISNYFKIAFRNLLRYKGYSFINIFGLATGMAVVMLIGLWIYDELSYNRYHKNYDSIAQVMENQHLGNEISTFSTLPMPLASELRTTYGSSFKNVAATMTYEQIIAHDDKVFTKLGCFSEPAFPEMLSLEMLSGARNALTDPNAILLSESLAKTIFGLVDPINQPIKLNNAFQQRVVGVYKDMPKNSQFNNLNFIAPVSLIFSGGAGADNWLSSSFDIYVQLNKDYDKTAIDKRIRDVLYQHSKDASKPELFLFPMNQWYLYGEFKNGVNVGGRIEFVWLFGIIGFFVLLLACINFMNLSTARSEKRAKEVGIRKAIGSVRGQLIAQFFSESLLVVMFAFILSIVLVMLALPFFNKVADKETFPLWREPFFWLAGIGFTIFTGLIAGSYPALYLSSFQPVKVLKGTLHSGRLAAMPRKFLLVMQFTVSVTLIIGTIVIFRQIIFAKNRPVGYSREGLLMIPLTTGEIQKNYRAFHDDLLQTNAVAGVARSSSPMTGIWSSANNLEWRGKDPNVQAMFGTICIEPDYGTVVTWEMKEGRNFSEKFSTDSSAFIFNESAIKQMGLKNPIGEIVRWHDKNWKIIGITKDIVMRSPFEPIEPTVFMIDDRQRPFNIVDIKINPAISSREALDIIEPVYKKYAPNSSFNYKFASQEYENKFRAEERIGTLATFFAILAIFISCLGLFGLASFVAEQRTKEIGIRKVLGASVASLWRMLSKDFVVLVMISCLIATPIAYYFMSSWLEKYTYRTEISWWIFVIVGMGAMVICLLTISYQAIKAALMNPVKTLKNE
ncbi:ABC transporter permease [Emticicia sp. BO119]|uniref:ABC transporter permease n=1 Tax=Emticicia sp. BO119 TaxID=2757768 RepID=UPI0015F0191A|nr:ABC transporter permease [Emticicia sp. BO119]MBA4850637.1 ABC transporter permease [Emticicia sp. BO119]